MLGKGTNVFLQFPQEARTRLLHQGTVVDLAPDAFQAIFDEDSLPLEAGQELMIYYETQRKFMKQSVRVIAVHGGGALTDAIAVATEDNGAEATTATVVCAGLAAALALVGQPCSAESRQCYRVSTAVSDHRAELAGEDCKLLDVSATGYAVLSKKVHKVGQVLDGAVMLRRETFRGRVCVQSVKDLGSGRFRYGLYCADERTRIGGLKEGLPKLTMDLQLEQLRRRSGAA